MNQRSIGYVGAIALAMAPLFASAQQPTPPERQTPPEETGARIENRTVEGEVVEVNAQRLLVRTTDGTRMTFTVDRDLTVGAAPIAVGDRVRVDYRSGVEPFAVVTVNRIPRSSDLADDVEEAVEDTGEAIERTADRVEDAFDDDSDDNGQQPARSATAPPSATRVQDPAPRTSELPDTASPLPALILAGLALVGSGLGLSARRRH